MMVNVTTSYLYKPLRLTTNGTFDGFTLVGSKMLVDESVGNRSDNLWSADGGTTRWYFRYQP